MDDIPDTRQWLADGIRALRAGDRETARVLLLRVIVAEPANERAWLWLSGAASNAADRRRCLARVLAINPENQAARQGLAALGVDPAELAAGAATAVDPDHPATTVIRRERPPLSPASAVLYPERQVEEWEWRDPVVLQQRGPAVTYQSASSYDDVWSGNDDLCGYCAHIVGPDDEHCPNCKRRLIGRRFRYEKPGANLYIYLTMILATAQFLLFLYAARFSLLPPSLQIGWGALVVGMFGLSIAIYGRRSWAYATSLFVLLLLTVAGLTFGPAAPLPLLPNVELLPDDPQATGLVRSATALLRPAILASSAIALLFGIFLAGPDFDRLQYRLLARVDKGLREAHHFYEVGRAYAEKGLWATAVVHWQRAAANDPEQIIYQRSLGQAYARLGYYERALDMLQSARNRAAHETVQAELDQLIAAVRQQIGSSPATPGQPVA